jgi:hypothetical protein
VLGKALLAGWWRVTGLRALRRSTTGKQILPDPLELAALYLAGGIASSDPPQRIGDYDSGSPIEQPDEERYPDEEDQERKPEPEETVEEPVTNVTELPMACIQWIHIVSFPRSVLSAPKETTRPT